MADHLRLLAARPLPTKRVSQRVPPEQDFDRGRHATTLRGILEGLESSTAGLFDLPTNDDDDGEIDARDLGEIVLKFTGRFTGKSGPFNTAGMQALAFTDTAHFYALTNAQSRQLLRQYAQTYIDDPDNLESLVVAWREILDGIDGISLYSAEDRIAPTLSEPDDDTTIELDIALWPTSLATRGARAEGDKRVTAVRALIDEFGQEDERVRVTAFDSEHSDRLLIRATVDTNTFRAVSQHPYVEKIRGPLQVSVSQRDLASTSAPGDTLLPEGAPIGIIDDLVVTANPWLNGVVVEQRSFPDGFAFGQPTRHGTHVAGFAAWGRVADLLDPDYDAQPHPIYVARVAQANEHFDPQFVGNASEIVAAALDWFAEEKVKVVVLAYAYAFADDGALISDLSATVDDKCREHDLVVVVSAGNVTSIDGKHWHADYPNYLNSDTARVAAPGTAALAVTVGSQAHDTALDRSRWPHGIHIADRGEAAPFSRTGPVRGTNKAGRQKPEFAGYGGTWGWDRATDQVILDDPNLAAIALIPPRNGRLFGAVWGTSYAAPQVAHEIARIKTRYPEAGANLLRALTALAGQAPPDTCDNDEAVVATYGVPNAAEALESESDRVTFVYEGVMATSSHTILEIPIPPEFARGALHRELRVALAYDPPTRRSRRDYIGGRITFDFHSKASFDDLARAYAEQPTEAEVKHNSSLTKYDKPKAVALRPPVSSLHSDTLVYRKYDTPKAGWAEDDQRYYLVLTHDHTPWWTKAQKKEYQTQRFAVAVRIHAVDHIEEDLYALAQARLQARARGRSESI